LPRRRRGRPPGKSANPQPPSDEPPPAEVADFDYYRARYAEEPFSAIVQFCRECLSIIDKRGRRVPLVLNSTQRLVLAKILELRAKDIPPRLIILKARQVGISTLIEAILCFFCLLNTHRSSLVIAHTIKSSRALFRMSRNFHRFLPEHLQQKRRIDNVHEIEFDSGSRMQIEVQGDPRGYTAQDVHLSEFASYEQPEDTLVAIMNTLPMLADSLGVIESTAKGVGNKFHKVWQRAVGLSLEAEVPEEERGWTPIFVPWFHHAEYRIPLAGKPFLLSADELRFVQQHPEVRPEQLKWRRWCITANHDGDEDAFRQEYPATAEEAFALSGRPAFDTHAVAHYTRTLAEKVQAHALPPRMEIESDPPGIGKVEIVGYDRGRLRIFREPQPRHTYIIGADPSEGDPGSDPSPLAVLCQQTMNLDATWYGKAPPDVLACHAIDLARYYRNGEIINEANNHGILFQETVLQLGYPHLYFRKVSMDSVAGEVTDKPGYLSTQRNREHLFNTLRKFVRMRMGLLECPHFVQQMQSLVYIENKAEAQPGCEKDLLVAFALCLMCHRGSMANPLTPLPEEEVRAVAGEIRMRMERDPSGAERYAVDKTGMTCEEWLKAEDVIRAKEARAKRFGVGSMR
jgi:hypothetical protein